MEFHWILEMMYLQQLYNSRHYNLFVTDRPKTDRYGRNSIPYRANQIWNLLPREKKSKFGFFWIKN